MGLHASASANLLLRRDEVNIILLTEFKPVDRRRICDRHRNLAGWRVFRPRFVILAIGGGKLYLRAYVVGSLGIEMVDALDVELGPDGHWVVSFLLVVCQTLLT